MSTDTSALFTPTQLGAVAMANRIVMAPMTRSRATPDGVPSPLTATYYSQRAGAGLIITEGVQPSYQGQGYCRTPGIHTSEQVAAWKTVTDSVHAAGGKIAVQIMHVGRIGHPLNQFEPVGLVAPSAIRADAKMYTDQEGEVPTATPTALSEEGVLGVIEEHRKATEMAFEAGFDAVELHGANGYLGQQFLSTGSNVRDDKYGGDADRRSRFVVDTLKAMATVDGPGRVGVRLSPGGTLGDISDDDTAETYTVLLNNLAPLDLAWVHFMQTGWDQPSLFPLITAPIILTGGFDGESGATALAETPASAIGYGRHYLANPDLPERIRHGHPLTPPDYKTFFAFGATPEAGYTDYPVYTS